MPIYEYHCPTCQISFDLQRRMASRDAPAACPACGGQQTTRAVTTFLAFGGEAGSRRSLAGSGCGACTPSPAGCATCGIRAR